MGVTTCECLVLGPTVAAVENDVDKKAVARTLTPNMQVLQNLKVKNYYSKWTSYWVGECIYP